MKCFPILALALWLSGCTANTDSAPQFVSCYDTGFGIKCAETEGLHGTATMGSTGEKVPMVCGDDGDGDPTSQSSDSGASDSDNGTSDSSDSPHNARILPTGGGDSGSDDSGESDSASGGDTSGSTSSDGHVGHSDSGDGSDSDADSDGLSDSEDCDVVDPDGNGTPPAPPEEHGECPVF